MTLSRRHIRDNDTCGIFKAASEGLKHTLMECTHAQMFWDAAKEILNIKHPRPHPQTCAKDIICDSSITEEDMPKLITIMYSIWLSRNNWTYGEKGFDPNTAMEFVWDTLMSEIISLLKKLSLYFRTEV
jgi:hypothetical protein